MPYFSQISNRLKKECHQDLITIFDKVIIDFDCSVICGHRNEINQNMAHKMGMTQLKFPESKHNHIPSMAIDVAPYPIDWDDIHRFYYFAGFVMGIATKLLEEKIISHQLRWGGDWNQNTQIKDNHFNDLVHFELMGIT